MTTGIEETTLVGYKAANIYGTKLLHDMFCTMQTALTFDDVLLEPHYSKIESRTLVNLGTWVTKNRKLQIPIIAANMDTVCESKMAIAMGKLGGLGVIHRYMTDDRQLEEVQEAANYVPLVAVAVGIKNGVRDHVKNLAEYGASIVVLDVAHGHHHAVGELLSDLKALNLMADDGIPIEYVAGNVATPQGVTYLIECGADAIKVGIGAGSVCTTRTVTGHGMPQLTAVAACALAAHPHNVPVIADGGFKNSGDMVKALGAGATSIMTGYLLRNAYDTPGHSNQKTYRGMASREAQQDKLNRASYIEGINIKVEERTVDTEFLIAELTQGIQSGLSYSGAVNIQTFQEKASFVRISTAGYLESLTVRSR